MSPGTVRKYAGELRKRRVAVDLAEASLAVAIRESLGEGYSAVDIAEAAGITRQRVYQIRDGRR